MSVSRARFWSVLFGSPFSFPKLPYDNTCEIEDLGTPFEDKSMRG
jgi:hypothetical protein